LNSGNLVNVEAKASQDNCGYSPAFYEEIHNSATTIIHDAWRHDFNLSQGSFEPNIKPTRNLIDLALESRHEYSLALTPQSWDRARGPFPEDIESDPSFAVGSLDMRDPNAGGQRVHLDAIRDVYPLF
jgi:hypothetical protein